MTELRCTSRFLRAFRPPGVLVLSELFGLNDVRAKPLCPVVASHGGKDHLFGRDGIKLSRALQATDIPRDIVTYPDAGHSYMNQAEGHRVSKVLVGRPLMAVALDWDASEDSWERIEAFFAEYL